MLLDQVLHEEPRRPRRINDKIPKDLETVCLKCLAKEPDRRYATATELANELGRFLAGEPVRARPVGRIERVWRWCRRKPLVAGLSAAAAFLFVLALGATSFGLWRVSLEQEETARQRDLAVRNERDAILLRDQEAKARREAVRLRDQEARARREAVRLGEREAKARQEAERERREARTKLRDSLLLQAQTLRQTTEVGRRRQAFEALRQAADLRPDVDLRNEYVRCLDLPDLQLVGSLSSPVAWYKGSDQLLDIDRNGLVVIDGRTGKWIRHLPDLKLPPAGFRGNRWVLSPDGRFLVTPGGATAQVWDLETPKLLGELKDSAGNKIRPFCLAISKQSDRLAAVAHPTSQRFVFTVYDLPSLTVHKSWEMLEGYPDCVRFSSSAPFWP
jgi:hypothetical protein